MPPMIGAGIIASQARLSCALESMMVGIPLGLETALAWNWVFHSLIV